MEDPEKLRNIVKEEVSRLKEGKIAPQDIRDDMLLFDVNEDGAPNLGLDSLDALELAMTIEDKYSITIPRDIDFKELATVNDVVAFVVRRSSEVATE